jgi:hypothetical protein
MPWNLAPAAAKPRNSWGKSELSNQMGAALVAKPKRGAKRERRKHFATGETRGDSVGDADGSPWPGEAHALTIFCARSHKSLYLSEYSGSGSTLGYDLR